MLFPGHFAGRFGIVDIRTVCAYDADNTSGRPAMLPALHDVSDNRPPEAVDTPGPRPIGEILPLVMARYGIHGEQLLLKRVPILSLAGPDASGDFAGATTATPVACGSSVG